MRISLWDRYWSERLGSAAPSPSLCVPALSVVPPLVPASIPPHVVEAVAVANGMTTGYHKPTGKGMNTMSETAVTTKEYRLGATALARRCGLSRSHVSRVLRGERPCGDTPAGRRLARLLKQMEVK